MQETGGLQQENLKGVNGEWNMTRVEGRAD